jgi:hypothetical protein
MVMVATMMSTAHANTAQTEPSHPINPSQPAWQQTGPKPPLGRAAGPMTAGRHGLWAGLRQGNFVGTKPNGNFAKALQMAYGK